MDRLPGYKGPVDFGPEADGVLLRGTAGLRKFPRVPTGLPWLDEGLGGGYPQGMMTVLYGDDEAVFGILSKSPGDWPGGRSWVCPAEFAGRPDGSFKCARLREALDRAGQLSAPGKGGLVVVEAVHAYDSGDEPVYRPLSSFLRRWMAEKQKFFEDADPPTVVLTTSVRTSKNWVNGRIRRIPYGTELLGAIGSAVAEVRSAGPGEGWCAVSKHPDSPIHTEVRGPF